MGREKKNAYIFSIAAVVFSQIVHPHAEHVRVASRLVVAPFHAIVHLLVTPYVFLAVRTTTTGRSLDSDLVDHEVKKRFVHALDFAITANFRGSDFVVHNANVKTS